MEADSPSSRPKGPWPSGFNRNSKKPNRRLGNTKQKQSVTSAREKTSSHGGTTRPHAVQHVALHTCPVSLRPGPVCCWLARPRECPLCPYVPRPLLRGCLAVWFALLAERHPNGFVQTAKSSPRGPHQALLCTAARRPAVGASRCKQREHVACLRAAGWARSTAYPSKNTLDFVK
jgi:hypothetical protein